MGNQQSEFMYMFERLNEPLYFGPRGNHNAYYNVDTLDKSTKKTSDLIRYQLSQSAVVSRLTFNVKRPRTIPNLQNLERACKRTDIFSYFLPSHKKAAYELIAILMEQETVEEFLSMCAFTRDSPSVNSQLWVHSVASASLRREDMREFRMPAIWEVLPELFIPTPMLEMARAQHNIPAILRAVLKLIFDPHTSQITINENFSGTANNPENKLWYFREDLGISSHHWHWHLVYPRDAPLDGPGSRDRKGELFYYMHRNMVQRYNAERICNGLPLAVPLDLTEAPILEEGYFPKLTAANAGRTWPGRQDNTKIFATFHPGEPSFTSEDMRKWRNRILNAIKSGYVIIPDGSLVELTPNKGIDILGGLVENGGSYSLNADYYGNIHDIGHDLIASAHDPYEKHNEGIGVMGNTVTAVKDPAFYRWHTYVENLFDTYKQTLPPYTQKELLWSDVRVENVRVVQRDSKNEWVTSWMESDIDLSRGLDLRRTSAMAQGPVWARVTHLTHEPFKYHLTVHNDTDNSLHSTLRIFMAPRYDENNERFPFYQQQHMFFEMDKAAIILDSGSNRISRASTDSTVTIPWEQSFKDLEKYVDSKLRAEDTNKTNYCGCGWPQHMLLPRGSADGVIFDVFVMLTDGRLDTVPKTASSSECTKCKLSVAFCGVLDEVYPDSKAMGFPFDRSGASSRQPDLFIEDFIKPYSNMAVIEVKITNKNNVALRGNGAPDATPVLNVFHGTHGYPCNTSEINFDDSL